MAEKDSEKKKMLKKVIEDLHGGASPTEVKEKFKEVLKDTKPEDIAKIEQELVKEGMPREELQRLCDVHMEVFGEQVQDQELHIPAGHPISILIEEHRIMLEKAERLQTIVKMIDEACDSVYVIDAMKELQSLMKDFQDFEKHYQREENVLFPTMEKHGVTEPPAIMWMEHNRIREVKKKLYSISQWNGREFTDFKKQLTEASAPVCSMLPDHFFKENNILFPTALQVIPNNEWEAIRKDFDDVGYPNFLPKTSLAPFRTAQETLKQSSSHNEALEFENGSLTKNEVEAILDTLPVDVSFIDKNDQVKYFNKAEKRIFVRTKSVIGRSVQLCHPQKSVHIVNKIVEAFTTGEKDTAEFWIPMNNRLIYIRYFAVRDKNRKYLGTMEITQDITDIKKIEGQKRLLDWKEKSRH